jgi:cadmium resistance protein CadD (predicted permease)
MKYALELLKQLFFIIVEIFWTIIKTVWKPLYTTTVKMVLVALLIFLGCHFIPHGIPLLKSISYLGWLTIIFVYRCISIKYDDFDEDEKDEELVDPENDETPEYLEDPQNEKPAPRNVNINDRTTSTRE